MQLSSPLVRAVHGFDQAVMLYTAAAVTFQVQVTAVLPDRRGEVLQQ